MIIILEGPDGGGKSSLAKRIEAQTGYCILPRDKPKTEEEKLKMYEDYGNLILGHNNVILDRSWYSEMVYGPIMRDEIIMSKEQMYGLEELIVENGGGLIIHCSASTELLWKRCQERGEDYITNIETLRDIRTRYISLLRDTKHLIPVLNYEVNSYL
jgi:thymidylate kinase